MPDSVPGNDTNNCCAPAEIRAVPGRVGGQGPSVRAPHAGRRCANALPQAEMQGEA